MQNPVTFVKERIGSKKEQKEIEKQQEYWGDVLDNLESFDGTPESQKEVRNVDGR